MRMDTQNEITVTISNGLRKIIKKLTDGRNPKSVISIVTTRMRENRYRLMLSLLRPTEQDLILDVGCGTGHAFAIFHWRKSRIVGLDLKSPAKKALRLFHSFVVGDARYLPFHEKTFDIIIATAIIEHVGSVAQQQQFIKELVRVGKRVFISTPNKYFPVEPHTGLPLFQFLPERVQYWITSRFALGQWEKGNRERINLLSRDMLTSFLTKWEIFPQRILGITAIWNLVKRK